ncbi:MAG: DUF1802 family protein [Coleofasciculaceae cyanobacterium]
MIKSTTTNALKEWAVAVEALQQGKTIMLLRKGGIKEESNRFQVTYNQVLLYPTYEHQQPHLLKTEYANQVKPVTSGWRPETILINGWAKITDILQVSEQSTVNALLPYHIWNEQFAAERFNWKPRQPLYVLLLRVYQLLEPMQISYQQEYGGCRSWINLIEPISIQGALPILTDIEYSMQVKEIKQIINDSPSYLESAKSDT